MNWPSLRSPIHRNIAWQVLAVASVACLGAWLAWNAAENFDARRAGFGLDFLARPANIPIGESLIDYSPGDANYAAILVGLLNTLQVALLGIVLATALGAVLGVARLSGNFLASRLAAVYVEFVRNVPLLAHLFVIYLLLQGLPPLRLAFSIGDIAFLSNRGLVVPAIESGPMTSHMIALAIILLAAALVLRTFISRRPPFAPGLARLLGRSVTIALVLSLAAAVCGALSVRITLPVLVGRNFVGGHMISPEMTALVLGLTLYYASFIGEIVRGGITSIPRGQWEAADALGIRRLHALRLVVLPQALRLMIPPTTSQYLDLAKMTSLAIAIGYPDLVAVANSIITDTGRAIECVAIIMVAFLLINLSISAAMNWLNLRMAPLGQTK